MEGLEVKAGCNLDKITWQVVLLVTTDDIGAYGFCDVKDPHFCKKPLTEAFFDLWPGNFDAQYELW